jgi:hypothetical protein
MVWQLDPIAHSTSPYFKLAQMIAEGREVARYATQAVSLTG